MTHAPALFYRSLARAWRDDPIVRRFAMFAGAILLVRIAALILSPLGLHPDEAQYWYWSRDLEWGYFSKPPLIAWIIAATTSVFGSDPWAVRLAAPILHTVCAAALFSLGRRQFGDAVGFWAGLSWLLIPGVWLSASIISTDAALLPIWAWGMLAAWRWIETRGWGWALATGAALGFGLLAKYAMLYFLGGLALAAVLTPSARQAFVSRQGLAMLAVAAIVIAPNLAWNAGHDLTTLSHTAANANWGGDLFNIAELGDFLADQFAIGLLITGALVFVLVEMIRGKWPVDERARFLIAFIAPPLLVIMAQALISRAHGNWAASAYPAVVLLVASRFATSRFLPIANSVHGAVFAFFLLCAIAPTIGDAVNVSPKNVSQMRAWDETAERIATAARTDGPYSAILVDHRHSFFELAYQWRDEPDLPPLRIWRLRDAAGNHAEAEAAMTPAFGERVLTAQMSPRYAPYLAADFTAYRPLDTFTTMLGSRRRDISLGEARGFDPVERTPDYLARIGD
jgi:4-amino-4-deoxy-L-arabinose transferase-like glycosyltransferase